LSFDEHEQKTIFTIFVPDRLRISFHGYYVSTKLEVSTAFLLSENRRHGTYGQKDGVQRLMRPMKDRIRRWSVVFVRSLAIRNAAPLTV